MRAINWGLCPDDLPDGMRLMLPAVTIGSFCGTKAAVAIFCLFEFVSFYNIDRMSHFRSMFQFQNAVDFGSVFLSLCNRGCRHMLDFFSSNPDGIKSRFSLSRVRVTRHHQGPFNMDSYFVYILIFAYKYLSASLKMN